MKYLLKLTQLVSGASLVLIGLLLATPGRTAAQNLMPPLPLPD